jgi:predicted pyridoxine 5'-phosphate oxidase superfamily flavin-nucleotide-binding protein
MTETGTYHSGERAVQLRAGVVDRADRNARVISREIGPGEAEFLADQPLVVAGWADPAGRVWCSLVAGPPGFLRAEEDGSLAVGAEPPAGDPLAGLVDGDPVGLLAIEPPTRRRLRVNGTVRRVPGGLVVRPDEIIANCPRFITRRDVGPASAAAATGARDVTVGERLTDAQAAALGAADTLFLATTAPGRGVDASHRGGEPGFVTVVDDRHLAWPDFPGNAMFLSLGNLELNPAAGILVVDWRTGAALQLTGRAHVEWAPGGDRTIRFAVDGVRERRP